MSPLSPFGPIGPCAPLLPAMPLSPFDARTDQPVESIAPGVPVGFGAVTM